MIQPNFPKIRHRRDLQPYHIYCIVLYIIYARFGTRQVVLFKSIHFILCVFQTAEQNSNCEQF